MTVAIVTDSLSDIPQEKAQKLGIRVVPLNVHFGSESYKDGVEIRPEEFYRRLPHSNPLPTTSQPSAGEFAETYREALRDADAIVSIHASAKVSGTYNSALLGRAQVLEEWKGKGEGDRLPEIAVIDTAWVSMGEGIMALAAARAAREGAALPKIVGLVNDLRARTQCAILVDTLEYLVKGGRIGKAQGFVGSLLQVKPLLQIRDGEVQPLERVRTSKKAYQRLQELALEHAPFDALAIMYNTTPKEAQELTELLRPHAPSGEVYTYQIGPVVGTHAGPGTLAVMWVNRKE